MKNYLAIILVWCFTITYSQTTHRSDTIYKPSTWIDFGFGWSTQKLGLYGSFNTEINNWLLSLTFDKAYLPPNSVFFVWSSGKEVNVSSASFKIGRLRDDEIARSLRYGVRHDGKAILDFMPFYDLSDNDLTAVISFLRTQEPVKNQRPQHEWNFLGKAVLAFLVEPSGDGEVPDAPAIDSTAAYGKYLAASVANCRGCHTKRDMMTGAYIGPEYAGGAQFEVFENTGKIVPGKHLVTPNLTLDEETGRIVGWSKKDFIERFRKGRLIPGSPMPWGPFSRMSDLELTALYKFITSVEPVKNAVPLGIQEGDLQ